MRMKKEEIAEVDGKHIEVIMQQIHNQKRPRVVGKYAC